MLCRPLSALVLLAVVATGCQQDDGVRKYTGTKPAAPLAASAEQEASGTYRILGAVFPTDEPIWFFKLTGPADVLAAEEAKFDEFLASVRFPNGVRNPPLWDLPEGWREGPQKAMRYATILLGPSDKPMEMSISQVGGGLQANIDRWADQLGMPGSKADLATATKAVTTTSGAKGLRVDLTGPKNPAAGGMMPPFMGGR
jgi:hypothetical protein